jgi:hypothetical protein
MIMEEAIKEIARVAIKQNEKALAAGRTMDPKAYPDGFVEEVISLLEARLAKSKAMLASSME